MFDELDICYEVDLATRVRVTNSRQVGRRSWPPARYLGGACHPEEAIPVLVQDEQLGTELSPADFDGANPISRTNVVLLQLIYPLKVLDVSDECEQHIRVGRRLV